MRPRLLDLFCGAGGAAVGYYRAGFDVIGVDVAPQPNYPFEFRQADALGFDLAAAGPVDAVHASPPCQRYVRSGMFDRAKHPDLLADVRAWLAGFGRPWVIENVPGAPMRADFRLCGCMFGLGVRRERWFETSWQAFELRAPCHHAGPAVGVYGHPRGRGGEDGKPWGWGNLADWVEAMGIDWMGADELRLAIPPAYTEYVGAHLLAEVRERVLTLDGGES
jgi:DNA (cytosine-5)-methyltransferase 1